LVDGLESKKAAIRIVPTSIRVYPGFEGCGDGNRSDKSEIMALNRNKLDKKRTPVASGLPGL
jgi:hypothetical protein